ncbi:MAG TPA: hypothetical protein VLD18_10920, partial [Verrucomicrobiae bacterium]|nr:hypothetical protein [Verrucomicrobiae bacterium]
MSVTAASQLSLDLNAWHGWIRPGSGFPEFEHSPGSRRKGHSITAGRASFDLPDAAESPTTSWDRQGSLLCVFSGRLYNDLDLAAEFSPRQPVEGFTPARFVIEAYRRWGCNAVSHLDGVYVWALWDRSAETLICSRDPVGIHPFFY